jgi:hypothetical protein
VNENITPRENVMKKTGVACSFLRPNLMILWLHQAVLQIVEVF